MEVVLKGACPSLKMTLPARWVEAPCSKLVETWRKKYGASSDAVLQSSEGTRIPMEWPIEAALTLYGSTLWVVSLEVEEMASRAEALYEAGDYGGAIAAYARALEAGGRSWRGRGRALSNRGAAALMVGDFARARIDCEAAVPLLPESDRPGILAGRACLRLGEFEAAREVFSRVLEKGEAARGEMGEEAQRFALEAARGAEEAAACRAELAKAERELWAKNNPSTAAKLAARVRCRACLGAPGRVVAARLEVAALARLGRWETAADLLDAEFLERPPKGALEGTLDRDACRAALRALSMVGRLEDARAACERWTPAWCREEAASLAALLAAKAVADGAFKRNDFAAAAAAYARRDHPVFHCNRAAALQALGRFDEAARACDQALAARPYYLRARLRRARCLSKAADDGPPDESFDLLERAAADYRVYSRAVPEDQAAHQEARRLADRIARGPERTRRAPRCAAAAAEDDKKTDAAEYAEYEAYVRRFQQRQRSPGNDGPGKKAPRLYALLGLARDATPKDIKRSYRALALKLHPDRNPSDDADDQFRQIHAAYEGLRP
ncbi:hypothetical protein CTAYLR_008479 [Chrysophaeum taylorii]|uniref:J domain-containing protein n=1 Tax=Chrysophaeum taylorii TaxID=2483200 RepID=A0AAD7XNC2_9STRA|nr:hypothetical protein CTAYLR_008479 [Chrysophaeum taylorii]